MTACNEHPPDGHVLHGTMVSCHADNDHLARGEPHTWDTERQVEYMMTRRAIERLLTEFPGRALDWMGPPGPIHQRYAPPDDMPSPWYIVKFLGRRVDSEYAIWRWTGETFMHDEHGMVLEQAFLPPL